MISEAVRLVIERRAELPTQAGYLRPHGNGAPPVAEEVLRQLRGSAARSARGEYEQDLGVARAEVLFP